jgi:hypothetical protein
MRYPPYMTDNKDDLQPMQKTKPFGTDKAGESYEPIEIPVPKKKDVLRVLKKSAQPTSKKEK